MNKKQVLPRVKVHLLLGKKITQRQCAIWFDGWRLADVVYKLKRYGLDVRKNVIRNKRTGVNYAQYYLAK